MKSKKINIHTIIVVLLSVLFLSSGVSIAATQGYLSFEVTNGELATSEPPQYDFWGFPITANETDEYLSLETEDITIEFYKGDYGYNSIYDVNGEVLVEEEQLTFGKYSTEITYRQD